MSTQWFTTLDEDRAQFGGYRVNPEKSSERILTRIFYGIDKVSFVTLRATLDSTTEVPNPKVDNQTYYGLWRIKDMRASEGEGDFAGSLTVYQDIANELNSGQGPDNEYLAGLQSDPLELMEYPWMKYTHYLKRTTKKWVNIGQSEAEDAVTYLGKIWKLSDIYSVVVAGGYAVTSPSSTEEGTWKYVGSTRTLTSTWGSKYYNCVVKGELTGDGSEATPYVIDDTADVYHILDEETVSISYSTEPNCTLTISFSYDDQTAIDQPFIESVRMQEEQDHSFTVYRTLTELSTPAVMRTLLLQYAGMTITNTLPVEDSHTIVLKGFSNETEKIYDNARFRIGGDVYTVTADATAVAGVVTLTVTPAVTEATVNAHTADVSNSGARAFFNALG